MNFKLYFSRTSKIKIAILCMAFLTFLLPFLSFSSNARDSEPCEEKIRLPVIMYHLVLKNPNSKNKFIISESTFEQDLKYISENGYETILVQDLIDFTQGKKELPKKPILLTFDDGAYNNYLYAFSLAKKYNAKFVFSPIVKETEKYSEIKDENPSYSHANWNHIIEMSKSGLVEIQNHTYDMHKMGKERLGCTKMKGETKEIYKEKLSNDITKAENLIEEKTGFKPTAFFYPFGAKSECSEEIIKSLGFKATFLCESKINLITKSPECLFGLHRFIRPPNISSKKFFETFEK